MTSIPQFGNPHGVFKDRPGAYAVLRDDEDRLLAVFVRGRYHLPGGGIDANEDPEAAVVREIKEETGYGVASLKKIGEANQFLETVDLGPINKLGVYFQGRVEAKPVDIPTENDHEVKWIRPEEFLASTAHDFHKWAVRTSFGL